jgi:hypothetical protein
VAFSISDIVIGIFDMDMTVPQKCLIAFFGQALTGVQFLGFVHV